MIKKKKQRSKPKKKKGGRIRELKIENSKDDTNRKQK